MPKAHKPKNLSAILLCLALVIVFNLAYYFIVKANPSGTVQFTADTIVSLSGINDGDLYIASSSQTTSLSISGSALTVTDIPDNDDFILKTSSHNNALKLTPAGGALDLTFASGNLSSGNITQWTLDGSGSTQVAHIVGVPLANTWYAIKVDSVLFNTFQSNASGEVSFTYDGSWSSKIFTIEEDTTAPASFSLTSPVDNYATSDSQPTFSWNASIDPDISYYQLYLDGSLDTNNISGTSTTPTNPLSCGDHTWYVKAVDNASNSTDSSTFNLTTSCGGGMPGMFNPPTPPVSSSENPQGGFRILINNGIKTTNSRTVTLKFNAGPDVKKMAISNDQNFTNSSQEAYQPTKQWQLTVGDELKQVYVKFYTRWGQPSEIFSSSIQLVTADTGVTSKLSALTEGSLVKEVGKTTVYLIENGQKRPIFHTRVFEAHNFSWSEIIETDDLSDYPNGEMIGGSEPSTSGGATISLPSAIFTKPLYRGLKNNDVKRLQELLASQSDIYPEGLITGYFGPLTQKAVRRFQMKHKLVTSKNDPAYGYVGPKTRAKLGEVFGE